ncbi:MAG: M14 family zinc carboxypeptidase, partial [Phycisphaerales bacterium]
GGRGVGFFGGRAAPDRMDALRASGIPFEVVVEDVQTLIDAETARILAGRGLEGGGDLSWFTEFKNPEQISAYIDTLVALRPDMATRETIGQSALGRTIYAIRIAKPGSPPDHPGILLNGVQHAREWVTAMSSVYFADRAVRCSTSDAMLSSVMDRFAIYVIPVTNPDGYAFTWTDQRLWRKTRRQVGTQGGQPVYGVDLNRNWSIGWGVNIPGFSVGSSGSITSSTYRGPSAFSEPETQVIRDWMTARPHLVGSVDVHAYGHLILSPFAYTNQPAPRAPLFLDLDGVMQAGIAAVNGLNYNAGPTFFTIYPAAGTFGDWAYGARNMFGWSIEQRDNGTNGFVLPPGEILPSATEALGGILAWADAIGQPIRISAQGAAVGASSVPAIIEQGQPTDIPVVVSALRSTVVPGSERLGYRIGRGGVQFLPLTLVAGDQYTATLPAIGCGSRLRISFEATAADGTVVRLPASGTFAITPAMLQDVDGLPALVPCPPCAVDFNLDGFVEPGDLDEFITAYFDGDTDADLDANGLLSPDDLDDFITRYFEGDC